MSHFEGMQCTAIEFGAMIRALAAVDFATLSDAERAALVISMQGLVMGVGSQMRADKLSARLAAMKADHRAQIRQLRAEIDTLRKAVTDD